MSYIYKCSQVVDVFIYSGVEPNFEERFASEYGVNKESPAYNQALNEYKASFQEHKSELDQKLELVSFANLINRNFSIITDRGTSDDLKSAVVGKLQDLTKERQEVEETFNPFRKLLHKIGQIFRGHGFRTEGDWAQNLVQRMVMSGAPGQIKNVKGGIPKQIKENIQESFQRVTSISAIPIPLSHMQIVNALTKEQFKEIISLYLAGPIPQGIHNVYKHFFLALNDEKKQWMMDAILTSANWPTQAVKLGLSEFTDKGDAWENLRPTQEMIRKVQEQPKEMFVAFEKGQSTFFCQAARSLLEESVKDLIDRNDVAGMSNFMKQTEGRVGCIAELLKQPDHFKPEQVAWLKENFKI